MFKLTKLGRWAQGIFFGWWVVGGAVGLQILLAGLLMQSYSTYAAVWHQEFGWSKAALAGGFSIYRGVLGILGPFQGWLLKRFGARSIIRVGLVLFGLGLMLLSRIRSLAAFDLVFLLLALGASFSGPLSLTSTVVNWFERRRSTALSFVQMGVAIGGLCVPLVAWSLAANGWRATTFASGLIVILVGLPVAQLMRSSPERYGLLPDNGGPLGERAAGPASRAGRKDFTSRQAMRTRAFWFIAAGHSLAVTVVSAIMVHLVVHLQSGLGYSLQAAAIVVALMTAFMIVGQLVGGFLGDRVDKRKIAMFAMFGHASALVALAFGSSLAWIVFFAVIHGLAWGLRGPQMQALRADYFGRSSFPTIMGFSTPIVMLGMVVGPILTGYLADVSGSYAWGFALLAGLALAGSVFFSFARQPQAPAAAERDGG